MSTIDLHGGQQSACAPSSPSGGEDWGEGAYPRVVAYDAWLSLAAAPTFALMALLTGMFGGKPDALCAAIEGWSPMSGMVSMYLLMSAFHLAPWFRLIRGR